MIEKFICRYFHNFADNSIVINNFSHKACIAECNKCLRRYFVDADSKIWFQVPQPLSTIYGQIYNDIEDLKERHDILVSLLGKHAKDGNLFAKNIFDELEKILAEREF